jgi:cell wall-associated NlpC family hydrolase
VVIALAGFTIAARPAAASSGSITTLSPGTQTVRSGARTQLLAHIMSGDRELAGVHMKLYKYRTDGSLAFLEQKTTDGTGHAHFYRYPKSAARYLVRFPGTSSYRTSQSKPAAIRIAAPAPTPTLGERAISEASRHYGKPYQYGAVGPDRFDCSGFTRYVYARFGRSLPHNSGQQYGVVQHVSQANKRVGDLIFMHSSGGSVYHVAIYAGNNQMWAATHSGDIVRKQAIYSSSYYVGRVA